MSDAYARGAASITALIDAQSAALNASESAANAVHDFLLDLMRVERAMGDFGALRTPDDRAQSFLERLRDLKETAMRSHRWIAVGLFALAAAGVRRRTSRPRRTGAGDRRAGRRPGGGPGEARYGGAIKADASVDVAFRMSGIVDRVTQVRGADGRLRTIQDGDPVRKGAVLARLRQDEFRDQVTDAEASLRQAQADYERASSSTRTARSRRRSTTRPTPATPRGSARQSQAAISLGDATLRSPIDGVILSAGAWRSARSPVPRRRRSPSPTPGS